MENSPIFGDVNFRLTGYINDPSHLDYDIFGLFKKRTIYKGELIKVEYYKNYDGVTYTELVIEETRAYTRDSNDLVMYRTQVSKWYMEDGSVGMEKTFMKYYSPQESIDEGNTRRSNVIADAKLYILSQVGLANGQDMLVSVANEIALFINGYAQPLRDAVANSTKPYLTQETKDVVVYGILTYL